VVQILHERCLATGESPGISGYMKDLAFVNVAQSLTPELPGQAVEVAQPTVSTAPVELPLFKAFQVDL
jgi:hypothetical protein